MKGKFSKILISTMALSLATSSSSLALAEDNFVEKLLEEKSSGKIQEQLDLETEDGLEVDLEKVLKEEASEKIKPILEEKTEEEKIKAELKDEAENLKVIVAVSDGKELEDIVGEEKRLDLRDYSYKGDYDVSITWESSDNSLIEIEEYDDGWGDVEIITYVRPPKVGEKSVSLTATISKGGYELKKVFNYTLKGHEEKTEEEGNQIDIDLSTRGKLKNNCNYKLESLIRNKNYKGKVKVLIALYEETREELISYSREIIDLNSEILIKTEAEFLIPQDGKYYIRVFILDNRQEKNILAEKLLKEKD